MSDYRITINWTDANGAECSYSVIVDESMVDCIKYQIAKQWSFITACVKPASFAVDMHAVTYVGLWPYGPEDCLYRKPREVVQ